MPTKLTPEEKFTYKKIGSFYFIIDAETGNKCTANGKVLRSKGVKKLAETLFLLREGYKKQLEQEEV
ncbi:hypothetical protein VPBG_00183 [Vibrio phage helene 12B3]|uniref:hypothetical protein n=1 Tax=Vibrio phage helene 12B3 TaxID=573173 RepID=UPI0002C0A394|nr:hypothetical protein VPBG_00183 [Vibrio phage helene 12B3]AGG57955.1 hypothetical protein VPBG_00183 [Vibrio phage helene 12B3]